MDKNVKIVVWVVAVLVVAWLGYMVANRSGQSNGINQVAGGPVDSGTGSIKLGGILSLTGDAAVYGTSVNRAVQVAIAEINKSGGINGRQLEIVIEDGKCDPQAGGTAAQKLVSIDKVAIIIGGVCSGETLAAVAITEPAKVILISPSASSPKITTAGDFVFRTYPSDAFAGKVAATYDYKELKARKAAVISELTDYAQGLRSVYKDSFTALGGTIVDDETYNTGETDFRTQVLKMKNSKPDVVYIVPQTFTPGVNIVKQMRENGMKTTVQASETLMSPDVVSKNVSVLNGIYGVEFAVDYVNNTKAKAFKVAHEEMFSGAAPDIFAANAYDIVYLIRDTIAANGGKVDTAKIRDFLYGVKNWQGAVGSLTIDKNGDPILGLNVRKIVGGVVTDIGPYTP